jgi:hypothetical protein
LRAFCNASFRPRKIPFNYIEVIGLVVAPVVALIALGDDPGGAAFILTAIGLGLTIAGPLFVSNRAAEPNYKVIRAWDHAMPPDWEATRRRYFAFNWIRAVTTWAAFALFLAAPRGGVVETVSSRSCV